MLVDLLIASAMIQGSRRTKYEAHGVADRKPKASGSVYRDEAADLMAAAARGTARPAPPDLELTARRAPPVVRPEAKRPLPYPEPVGINDNSDDIPQDAPASRAQRRRMSIPQLIAWLVISPLYLAVAAAALGIIALFGKGLLAL
jgi:hypothetical protein